MKKTLRSSLALALALMLTFVMGTAMAAFPEKEVTIVVPYKAGGNVDLCCRIIADEMTKILGKQVIVEDREGGGAIIGQTYALNQPADGYTLLALTSSFVTNILSGDTCSASQTQPPSASSASILRSWWSALIPASPTWTSSWRLPKRIL